MNFSVVFERDEDGYYVASVPSLVGCHTQGKTFEQAKNRIKEVIELCLEDERIYKSHYVPSFVGIDQAEKIGFVKLR